MTFSPKTFDDLTEPLYLISSYYISYFLKKYFNVKLLIFDCTLNVSIKFLENFSDRADKLFSNVLVAEDVVGSDAGLTQVGQLSPDDPLDGQGHVDGLVQVERTLPAELEGAGSQVLGCSLSDDSADLGLKMGRDIKKKSCSFTLTVFMHSL